MVNILSQQQQDILIGLLLGDGSLEYNGYIGTRLQIKQTAAKKEYVFWLYEQFSHLVKTPPQHRQDNNQWYFGTRYIEEFTTIKKLFYQGGRKIIPSTITKLFQSPLTLAIWYMDDGTLDFREKYHYSFSMSTDAFSIKEVKTLQTVLWNTFSIESSIQSPSSRGKKYIKLYIGKRGRDQFLQTIQPYILSCFAYKLPLFKHLDPSETEPVRVR
ncbi:MAG: hypothetical protein HYV32_02245 [Candidatus Kerfeldbacteria bacterium]|nr:hypothetical protein [Candidatus Kerfeldbacteria bacterium]